MDIADLFGDNRDRISKEKGNENMKYILIIINALTKYAYAYPLPDRQNKNIIKALETAFKDMNLKKCPRKNFFETNIQVDQEFIVGKKLQQFFKDWCINVYYTQSKHKACMAERYVRYLKEKLVNRMESKKTEVWVPLLKDLLKQYNTLRKQNTTDMTPKTAEKYPSLAFVKILEKNVKKAKINTMEGETFVVDWDVIRQSMTIRTMLGGLSIKKDVKSDVTLFLDNKELTRSDFKKALVWMEKYRGKLDLKWVNVKNKLKRKKYASWSQLNNGSRITSTFLLMKCFRSSSQPTSWKLRGLLILWPKPLLCKSKVKLWTKSERLLVFKI